MILRELVFQGIYDCHKPVRLFFEEGISEATVPEHVTMDQIVHIITALFYPSWQTAEVRKEIESSSAKLAVTFDFRDRRYRLLRKASMESIRLQTRDGDDFVDVIVGAEVEDMLLEKMRFPSYHTLLLLAFWRFDHILPSEPTQFDFGRLDAKTREIVRSYRIAIAHEALEDRVKSLEGELDQAKKTLGDGAKLEEKLKAAKQRLTEIEVKELSEEDLQLLKDRESKLDGFQLQVQRLTAEEETARNQVDNSLPEKPWKQSTFLVGLLIFAGTLGLSIAFKDQYRLVAVADVIGITMCAWVMLRYFNDKERASVHLVRLDSIKRRLNQVREEQVAYKERLKHLLIHAGVDNEAELAERFDKSKRLAEIIVKMEEQYEKISSKPDYQKASRELRALEEELSTVQAEYDAAPRSVLSAYQLENDLNTLGVNPHDALIEREQNSDVIEPYNEDIFTRLYEVAKQSDQVVSGTVSPKVISMWSKIAGHVLGSRFANLSLTDQGKLRIKNLKDEQVQLWLSTRKQESYVVGAALALALLVNLPDSNGELRVLIIEEPESYMSAEHADRFFTVFESASQKAQVVLVDKRP